MFSFFIVVFACVLILSAGCVRSTAQWVVDNTEPKSEVNNTPVVEVTPDDGVVFNDRSSEAWSVLVSIGFLIFVCCAIPYYWSKERFERFTKWIREFLSKFKKKKES